MKNLLLLHGALGSKDQFTHLKNKLSKSFNVHTLNFSGHGGMQVDDINFSIDIFCTDVIAFLQSNDLQNIDIFGYSMGGYVAVSLAAKHPQLVSSIFTLATRFNWSPEQAIKETSMLDSEKIETKVPAFALELQKRHAPADWKLVMQKTSALMIALGAKPLMEDDFKKVNCPVRISVGDRDKMVSIDSSLKVSQFLMKGSLLVIPDTPHPFETVDLKRLVWELENFFLK